MKQLQEKVEKFVQTHHLNETPPEFRFIDLISEIGEVGKELLKVSNYGKKHITTSSAIKEELGDVFFSLIVLANRLDIDLETELDAVLKKYQKRITEKNNPGSD